MNHAVCLFPQFYVYRYIVIWCLNSLHYNSMAYIVHARLCVFLPCRLLYCISAVATAAFDRPLCSNNMATILLHSSKYLNSVSVCAEGRQEQQQIRMCGFCQHGHLNLSNISNSRSVWFHLCGVRCHHDCSLTTRLPYLVQFLKPEFYFLLAEGIFYPSQQSHRTWVL